VIRVKSFDATGIAPGGKLYAGDLNAIQDAAAGRYDLTQNLGALTLAIGEAGLLLQRFGAGEARISGALRTDGIVRALGGFYGGAFTTAQRNAIAAGSRPYGLVILNTDNNRYEWNQGTDAVPSWQSFSASLGANSVGATELADNAVDAAAIQAGVVDATKIAGSLKPSVSAAAATESLRALGTTASTAAAGNDARLSDQRTPPDNSVTNAKMADNSVGTLELIDANVTLAKLAADSVNAAKIVDGSVGLAELAADSVNAAKIVDGSVGDAELALSYLRAGADGLRYQAGSVSGTTTAGGTTVNFPTAFGATPVAVVLTNSAAQAIILQSKSASSFVFAWAGMGTGDGYTIDYVAIGAV
jgi:hypothetical protein